MSKIVNRNWFSRTYTKFVFNLANIKVLSEIDFAHTRNYRTTCPAEKKALLNVSQQMDSAENLTPTLFRLLTHFLSALLIKLQVNFKQLQSFTAKICQVRLKVTFLVQSKLMIATHFR